MAYQMTFSSLLDDAKRYLERGFTATEDPYVYQQLPRLINMAERRCARELKVQGFIKAVTTPLVVGQSTYQKPDRWRDTVSMRVNGQPIFSRSYEYARGYWPDDSLTGVPEFYADYNYQHWVICPTPSLASQLEIVYYEQPQLLDDENQVNWLTAYAPNLLLYATLLEATPFIKNDERIVTWQNAYDRAAQSISGEDLKKILDRAAIRSDV